MQGGTLPSSRLLFIFFRHRKKTEPKERCENVLAQRPAVRFSKSLNELASLKQHFVFRCSDCSAIRDSITIQKILHPLKTSSCGMFSSEHCERENMEREVRLQLCCLACPRMFSKKHEARVRRSALPLATEGTQDSAMPLRLRRMFSKKHVARSAVTALPLGLSKHPWRRRAFSVVG
ncbi:hypothetical protein SAMN04487827_1670 [Prevotella sp. khp7]|nr:hypothetical protein SAMN04487827_1670 [Prevotella sp. khp7]